MITIKEIARECGVSVATVSNVINGKKKVGEETRRRIVSVMEEHNYRPNMIAWGLRKQSTKTIAIIAEDIAQFTTPLMIEIMMYDFEAAGYRTIVSNLRMSCRRSDAWFDDEAVANTYLNPTLERLSTIMVDGIIYIAGHARQIDCFPDDFDTPAVMAYAYTDNPNIPSVVIDDISSSQEIMDYLIKRGHRKIGIIGGRPDNMHTQDRLKGAKKALKKAGIPFEPELVRYADWSMEGAYKEAGTLLKIKGITAVFCMADRMAGGVYKYLYEKGLRPGHDIAVAGFDNQDISEYFIPGLTTMSLPLEEIGHKSARVLLENIEANDYTPPPKSETICIPCTLVERESVNALKP